MNTKVHDSCDNFRWGDDVAADDGRQPIFWSSFTSVEDVRDFLRNLKVGTKFVDEMKVEWIKIHDDAFAETDPILLYNGISIPPHTFVSAQGFYDACNDPFEVNIYEHRMTVVE